MIEYHVMQDQTNEMAEQQVHQGLHEQQHLHTEPAQTKEINFLLTVT